MGDSNLASLNFEQGFQSDIPRQELPRGVAYRMVDWIPANGAPLRKRGGWTRASRDLNAVSALTRIESLGWCPFPNLNHLIAISDNGKLFEILRFDGAAVANCGTLISTAEATNPRHPPFYHGSATPLVVIPDSLQNSQGGTSAAVRKYYDTGGGAYGTAVLGGTPPKFTCGASWGDYVIGANGFIGATRYPNRVWFSDPGLPETWNPTTSFVDLKEEILAVVPRNRMLMCFGNNGVHLLLGTIPPPGGDFEKRDYFYQQGVIDAKTVQNYRDYTIWANNVGVWKSDGSTLTDLTEVGGISLYWQSLMAAYDPFIAGYSISAGIYRGCYFIALNGSGGQPLTTLVCDLDRNVWFEMANLGASMFASRPAGQANSTAKGFEEMFIAGRATGPVGKFVNNASPMWTPSSANPSDADATAVLPVVEAPFFKQGAPGLKRFRRGYINYLLTTSSGATLQVAYAKSADATSYTNLSALAALSAFGRKPFTIGKQALGLSLKISLTAAANDAMLGEIEFDGHAYERSR